MVRALVLVVVFLSLALATKYSQYRPSHGYGPNKGPPGHQGPGRGRPPRPSGPHGPYRGKPGPYSGKPGPYRGKPGPYRGKTGPYKGKPGPYRVNPGPLGPYGGNPRPGFGPGPYYGPYRPQKGRYPPRRRPPPRGRPYRNKKRPYKSKTKKKEVEAAEQAVEAARVVVDDAQEVVDNLADDATAEETVEANDALTAANEAFATAEAALLSLRRVQHPFHGTSIHRGISEGFSGRSFSCSGGRRFGGLCSNRFRPFSGTAGRGFRRRFSPRFGFRFGGSRFRSAAPLGSDESDPGSNSVPRRDLPDPMFLSKAIFEGLQADRVPEIELDGESSMFTVAWLQMIADDVSSRGVYAPEEGAITCCDPDNPECVGIPEYVAASTEASRSREPECTVPGFVTAGNTEVENGDANVRMGEAPDVSVDVNLGGLNEMCYQGFGFGVGTYRDCDESLYVCIHQEIHDQNNFKGTCQRRCGREELKNCPANKLCYVNDAEEAVCHCWPNEVDIGIGCEAVCSSDADCDEDMQCIDPDRDGSPTCYDYCSTPCGHSGTCYIDYVDGDDKCFCAQGFTTINGLCRRPCTVNGLDSVECVDAAEPDCIDHACAFDPSKILA